jgi:superfamily I DNA/RNA helicase
MEDELNSADGPVLVLAAPGTGKTHRIAQRVKYLVEDAGVPPDAIAVVTFTDAAAREMRTQMSDPEEKALYVRPDQQPHTVSTMHSFG